MRLLVVDSGATMSAIAEAVGVSRATLHRWYPSRLDLIEVLAVRVLTATRVVLDEIDIERGPILDVLSALIERLTPIADQYAFLLAQAELDKAKLYETQPLAAAANAFEARMIGYFQRGQAEGVFRLDLPAGWLTTLLGHTLIAASDAVREGLIGHREAPRLILASFLGGAAQPPR